jgi:hypothetical protein
MKKNARIIGISILVCLLLAACGPKAPAAIPTMDSVAISATQTAQAPTSTFTPEPTATCTSTPTETPTPTQTPDLSATAAAATQSAQTATQQANQTATAVSALSTQEAVDALWAQLIADGTVTYKQGDLFPVDDFEQSWAQRDWYQWWWFGYNISDFVLTSHVDWETAEASFGDGGCGFTIRIKDDGNHLVIFITPKGEAILGAWTANGFQFQPVHWSNPNLPTFATIPPDSSGEFDLTLVAEKDFVTAYINGEKAYQWYVALTSTGDIGYTVLSGTNKDFGTYCKFTNTQLWELLKQ